MVTDTSCFPLWVVGVSPRGQTKFKGHTAFFTLVSVLGPVLPLVVVLIQVPIPFQPQGLTDLSVSWTGSCFSCSDFCDLMAFPSGGTLSPDPLVPPQTLVGSQGPLKF